MKTEQWQRVKELFEAALEHQPRERRQFLEQVCGDDLEVREEVVSLLASHEQAGAFIGAPAIEDAAHLLFEDSPEPNRKRLIGHYRVLALLGRGGMGEVHLAIDARLGRKVALKLLPAEFAGDADRVKLFEREARTASALNHPNILTIHEIGRDDDTLFIATEFVEGRTLRQRLAAGATDPAEAAKIAIQLAAALDAAHKAGIVHRDIKPENIMLRSDGYLKVLDFGLAKPVQAPVEASGISAAATRASYETKPGMLIGTVRYMSPEQVRGQKADARSDLWSLGAVLYEMLAGFAAFDGETPSDIIAAVLTREPPLTERLAPEWRNIIGRTLAKECRQRYQSTAELGRDLKELLRKLERREGAEASVALEASNATASVKADETRQVAGSARRKSSWAMLAALLFVLANLAVWAIFVRSTRRSPASAPLPPTLAERVISHSLTVQKMQDDKPLGAPFEATGRESFERGWKFRLRMISPQAGHLYLLNEGPASIGGANYRILFPIASTNGGSARLAANEPVQTGWYVFDERPGVEKLWIVWATQAVDALEAIKDKANPVEQGVVGDLAQRQSVREWLALSTAVQTVIETDAAARRTVVKGRGETLISLLELEHR